jgi:hypothetical protein
MADMNVVVLRPIIPLNPVRWLVRRARVYLAVMAVVGAGFFFVAGWLGAPLEGEGGSRLMQTAFTTVMLIVGWVLALAGSRAVKDHDGVRHPDAGS